MRLHAVGQSFWKDIEDTSKAIKSFALVGAEVRNLFDNAQKVNDIREVGHAFAQAGATAREVQSLMSAPAAAINKSFDDVTAAIKKLYIDGFAEEINEE